MNAIALIQPEASLWNDARLATGIAVSAVLLLFITVWLMRRKSRDGRGAAAICLILSVSLHALLLYFLPALKSWGRASSSDNRDSADSGMAEVTISDFNPNFENADASLDSAVPKQEIAPETIVAPLPIVVASEVKPVRSVAEEMPTEVDKQAVAPEESELPVEAMPSSLASSEDRKESGTSETTAIDDLLTQWLSEDAAVSSDSNLLSSANASPSENASPAAPGMTATASDSNARPAHIPGLEQNDFGQRAGDAKRLALLGTGGDESTEAAVEAALRFLAADQRLDGAWDPATSGAGRETQTLGTDRGGAGRRATNGITGLALLSMLGAGNTHLEGAYADNVRRGLSYLIRSQHPDGSLAGPATVYEANYCHGMAALAMCEAAAMTGDESAKLCAAAAVRFTTATQHPTTGGWRYVKGDPGDLSQLGWQAMVLDGGRRASLSVSPAAFAGASRFLRSVRSGQNGGLASYRPSESPTRTMTAEALATRLLLGETIPPNEIQEAESFLLRQTPGVGKDNYYGWYYTALALHQLQDDAWRTWNEAMKSHLLARQESNGSWPTDDEWGGYGGRIYTTSMAALCLEVYYRHAVRSQRTANANPTGNASSMSR
jgi:hypothetical protein